MRMEEYTVYMHRCPNGKVYVGITSCSPKIRWANGNGYKGHKRFYEDIIKYGWDNIQHLILFDGLSMEQALRKEKDLIKQYNARDKNLGYNVRSGGQLGPYSIDTINGKERKIDFKFRVSEKEKADIEEMADDMGLTVSAFLRYLVAKERKEKRNG